MGTRDTSSTSDHSYTEILQDLRRAVAAVGQRVHVPSSSRVHLWVSAIERLSKANKREVLSGMIPSLRRGSFEHEFQDSFRALVDARTFVEIIEQLLPQLADHDLKDLISGNLLPGDDHPSSRARDREFELFAAAICSRSGLQIELKEPDVMVHVGGDRYAIAAKRLRSLTRVRKNLAKAARQIRDSKTPGFIFADVSQILNPDGTLTTHWTEASDTVRGAFRGFQRGPYGAILRADRGPNVRGTILRAAFPYIAEEFRYGTFELWNVQPCVNQSMDVVHSIVSEMIAGVHTL